VDEVVIAGMAPASTRELVETCDEAGLPALVRLDEGGLVLFPPAVEVVGTSIYMRYLRRDPDPGLMLIKGLFDRLAAAGALLCTVPLGVAIAVAIKVGSKGPVLFVQRRGGLHGRPFSMLKFRTMRQGAEAEQDQLLAANEMDGPVFKMQHDPRVTPIGRWLRRTSLDELPQFLNVLRGDLSLVGPRPHALKAKAADQLYDEVVAGYFARHKVRPGITGWAQINGWRGETDTPEKIEKRFEHDLYYIENWSVFLDLYILLMTPKSLLKGDGAY
jgi:exopolysaccharide biosynthesis polyprenyl glycosylphosphotransferase